jgi:hypothetical protein
MGIIAIMISGAYANYWSTSVGTNTSIWYLYRQSSNVSFDNTQTVVGTVSQVHGPRGRILSPYLSTYEDIKFNDVALKERRSAREGSYESAGEVKLRSRIDYSSIDIDFFKPSGSNIYTFSYPELWSVQLMAAKTINYSGRQINDLEFRGNNLDFVKSNLLYNTKLTRDSKTIMWLQRMNATVWATDDAIILAEFKPTKYLGQLDRIHTTGIADLSYRQADWTYDVKRMGYPSVNEGRERYYGTYDLARMIEMRSIDDIRKDEDDWLPCCYGGWESMDNSSRQGFGAKAASVFNCSCYDAPVER